VPLAAEFRASHAMRAIRVRRRATTEPTRDNGGTPNGLKGAVLVVGFCAAGKPESALDGIHRRPVPRRAVATTALKRRRRISANSRARIVPDADGGLTTTGCVTRDP
jgi:hypothetical protein